MTGLPAVRRGAVPVLSVTDLEEIAAAGWPGTEQRRVGGWLLRAGGGFTGRANSALPIGDPGVDDDAAIAAVCRFYTQRGLPARFQIVLAATGAGWRRLDAELAARGWTGGDEAVVMTADLAAMLRACRVPAADGGGRATGSPAGGADHNAGHKADHNADDEERAAGGAGARRAYPAAEFAAVPSPEWLGGYRYRGSELPDAARAVLCAGAGPVFALLRDSGRRVAVARGIVTDRWLGVTALTVEPADRRRGAATRLMAEMGAWARSRGARSAYLQVAAENGPALELYRGLGFSEHHRYHYRTAPPDAGASRG